ncbi:MAG: NAD(P)/FAD-dependent oxidoreductase [Ignavibacteria bacterium]
MKNHVIIGAGPAGLTAGWELVKLNKQCTIVEKEKEFVGGIARTVVYKGYRFDLGGHRFYTKSEIIEKKWQEMLPKDFIKVPRLSRIYYNKKFFPYPIEIKSTLLNLGIVKSFNIGLSFILAKIRPRKPELSFEDWVVNRFGYELYSTFFKSYTEKVWGIKCEKINKDWAGQRIRGLSLLDAVKDALFKKKPQKGKEIKTLIKRFYYPRLGPGQLWESVRDEIVSKGNEVIMGRKVVECVHDNGIMKKIILDNMQEIGGDEFYSTMTLKDLINSLNPKAPEEVLNAANRLSYRDFMLIALIIDKEDIFPDNWIYVHDPDVKVGRIQNFKNWSKEMLADNSKTCIGMEYFCNTTDEFWSRPDDELIELAKVELEKIGLATIDICIDGSVVRNENTYPIYDNDYKENLNIIKKWLNGYFKNLYPAGRGALHNYNSQDHSMMAAILSVKNMIGDPFVDVWEINTDSEYAEEGNSDSKIEQRLVPKEIE